jgi:hypothetical protein
VSRVLVDTSVWIEFLRGTGSPAHLFVREQVGVGLATTEPILMELLAGAASGQQTEAAEKLMLGQHWVQVQPALDYRAAADIFQAARASGHPPRSLQDCLIAAIALRTRTTVAHRDADYTYIAAVTGLAVVDLR